MKVPVDEASKRGLIRPRPSNSDEAVQTARCDGHQDYPNGGFFAKPINGPSDQQQPAQVDRSNPTPCRQNRQPRKILELYTEGDGVPGNLRLRTSFPSLASSKKLFLDAITPPLCELMQQCSGIRSADDYPDSKGPFLTSNAGRVQKHKSQTNLPDRKKRSHPPPSTSSGKRLKPSLTYSAEMSTNPFRITLSETDAESPNVDRQDGLGNDDSDSDEYVIVREEATLPLKMDQTERIGEYYCKAFTLLGQLLLKVIMKVWIKVREPGKQVRHPYNGGNNPSDDSENPGRDSAPEWWCNQDNWKSGLGCRHKEPDHLGKKERLYFSPMLLRQTSSAGPGEFTVQRLRDATDLIEMTLEQSELLKEVYDVREKEQEYEETRVDATIYVRESKPQPPSKKKKKKEEEKKPTKKANKGANTKQRYNGAQGSSEELTSTNTASVTGDVRSSPHPAFSPVAVKIEHAPQDMKYASAVQAPLPQYNTPYMSEDMFNPLTPDAASELSAIVTSNNQLGRNKESLAQLDAHFVHTTLGSNNRSMGELAAFSLPTSGPTSQLPIRNANDDCRRAASVLRHDSPSYTQAWPPRTDQYIFNDDTVFGRFRMPRTSFGKPSDPLPVAIDAPNNHSHGLPWHIQQPLCASHNCQNGHTHGWRPMEEQHHECARNRCHEDPRNHPLVFTSPAEQLPNQQLYDTNFDSFLAANPQGFGVTKSLP